jgi:hypothetical protein
MILDGMKSPGGVSCDSTRLYVADTGNSRILIYNNYGPLIVSTPAVLATSTPTDSQKLLATVDLTGKQFMAFPNPARDKVTFVLHTQRAVNLKIVVYNSAGERAAELHASLGAGPGQSAIWDCHGMAPGIYIAHLLLDEKEIGNAKVAVVR